MEGEKQGVKKGIESNAYIVPNQRVAIEVGENITVPFVQQFGALLIVSRSQRDQDQAEALLNFVIDCKELSAADRRHYMHVALFNIVDINNNLTDTTSKTMLPYLEKILEFADDCTQQEYYHIQMHFTKELQNIFQRNLLITAGNLGNKEIIDKVLSKFEDGSSAENVIIGERKSYEKAVHMHYDHRLHEKVVTVIESLILGRNRESEGFDNFETIRDQVFSELTRKYLGNSAYQDNTIKTEIFGSIAFYDKIFKGIEQAFTELGEEYGEEIRDEIQDSRSTDDQNTDRINILLKQLAFNHEQQLTRTIKENLKKGTTAN